MLLENTQVIELAKPFIEMLNSIENFYNNSENKRKYIEWHIQKYGCKPEGV